MKNKCNLIFWWNEVHHYKDGVQDLKNKMPGGRWTHVNGVAHINILELLAIFFLALKSLFKKFSQNIYVLN